MLKTPKQTEIERVQRIMAKLSPQARDKVRQTPALVAMEAQRRKKFFPSKDHVPNIGQQRFFEHYRSKHEEYKDYPFIGIFRGANGVGKTATMAIMLAGMCLGPEFVNQQWLNLEFFLYCQEIRARETLYVRIVCDGSDVTMSGSVYQQIKKWIPSAQWGDKQGPYYTTVTIPAPLPGFNNTVIDIKTHGQETVAHAGPDLHVILFNEPAPEKLWGENMGRLRLGGRSMCFLTPMNAAAYLHKIEIGDHPPGEVAVVEACIYDNCADTPGTRGILSKENIERMIRRWRELNPLELPARRDGKYMHLAGVVFTIFSFEKHVIKPTAIDPLWNIRLIVDPHPVKPPFALWIAITPLNFHYVIAEYPVEPWDQITTTHYSIEQHCFEFRRIMAGKHQNFPYIRSLRAPDRIGDPNKFKERLPNSGLTYKQEFEIKGGMSISTRGVSDDLQVGHDAIRSLLLFDPEHEPGPLNCPKLYIFDSCKNTQRALAAYAYKTRLGSGNALSENIEETWACPVACLRYHATSFEPWTQTYAGAGADFDEQDIIDQAESGFYREERKSFDAFDEEEQNQPAYTGERLV